MKRSEMKARLIEAIYDYIWCNAADEFADHMLSFLESQGMQPPPYAKPVKDGEYYTFAYEWEPEDEEK